MNDAVSRLFDLSGKSVLVTGGASGLGRAMAEVSAAAGAEVMLADLDGEGAARVAADLRADGAVARAVQVDVADPAAVAKMVASTEREVGGIDVVFANAGISAGRGPVVEDGRLENVDLDRWERVMAVNLTGVLSTIKAAVAPLRRRGGGKIIVTSSIAGLAGNRLVGYGYIASKAAVANLVRQAAIELAPDNIQVNAIAPGAFSTNIGGAAADPAKQRPFALDAPAQRVAAPEEIKGLALLLAAPASSYLTGAVIPIDGGTLAGVPIRQEVAR